MNLTQVFQLLKFKKRESFIDILYVNVSFVFFIDDWIPKIYLVSSIISHISSLVLFVLWFNCSLNTFFSLIQRCFYLINIAPLDTISRRTSIIDSKNRKKFQELYKWGYFNILYKTNWWSKYPQNQYIFDHVILIFFFGNVWFLKFHPSMICS